MRRFIIFLLLISLFLPASGLCADDFLLGVQPAPSSVTPACRSAYHPGHENCYWCTPMNLEDEAAVWRMLTAPVTVVQLHKDPLKSQMKQTVLYAEPDDGSEKIGMITGESQAVHVLETRSDGWSLVETYSTSFFNSKVKNYNAFVTGYIRSDKLKTVEVNQHFGIVIDKLTQRLYFFMDGYLETSLAVSTGLFNEKQPYNETRSGEYLLLYYRKGDLPDGKMHCYYPIRFNAADYLHEVPCTVPAGGKRSGASYQAFEPLLGQRASHGCIRVQRLTNAQGYKMSSLFKLLKEREDTRFPKLVVWEDYQSRQVVIPPDDTPLYYNPDGGSMYHAVADCPGVKQKFKPLKSFTYGELESEPFAELRVCPNCQPTPRKAFLEEINQIHQNSSPGDVMSYWP